MAPILRLILLTIFRRRGNIPSIRWYIWLETRLNVSIFDWKRGCLGKSELKKMEFTAIRGPNSWLFDSKKYKNTQNILHDGRYLLFEEKNLFLYPVILCREIGKGFEESLREGSIIYIDECFSSCLFDTGLIINNYWIRLSYDVKNSAGLGGCYPPRPRPPNSSHPSQPHAIIVNY